MKKTAVWMLVLCLIAGTVLPSCRPRQDDPKAGNTTDAPAGETVDKELTDIPDGLVRGINTLSIACIEGTDACWALDGQTLTFSGLTADTVCAVSGAFDGCIVIDAGENFSFELEMRSLTLFSETDCPITVMSGDSVKLTAKKETKNEIYDLREAVADGDAHAAAIFADCDLKLGGKGALTVISAANNGIHTKDDLSVENLTLAVTCENNALKGNDGVRIQSGTLTLIARAGDGIKTSSTDISAKGKQKGSVTLSGGTIAIYAACDGIDAAFDAEIGEEAVLNIYTDKYSPYSEEVTATNEDGRYIRFTSKNYAYAVQYYNGENDYKWVTAEYKTSVNAGRGTYYYYSLPMETAYAQFRLFIYSSTQTPGQDSDYLVCSDYLTWNSAYDTFALSQNGSTLSYNWTNYSSSPQDGMGGPGGPGGMRGPGGMEEGNTDKGDHSAKGIKAGNEIRVSGGTVLVRAYDDALHASKETASESGVTPSGNVTISGGTIELYSNDDAIHADGTLTVAGGEVNITGCYEGLEGADIVIGDGNISVVSRDDGLNSTSTNGTGITVSGGTLYVYAGGDGIDANTRTAYQGIVFTGGDVTVISTSNGNSSLDTEQGYTYSGGHVLAIGASGGMSSETTHCKNFSSVASKTNLSLKNGQTVSVRTDSETVASVTMPCALSAMIVYLGSSGATITAK